ncbi:MAG TPA: hypothetical protein VN747_02695 [Burkholderiales bacterium]|nr:hypothetical protein [Burkholderiales bacterium]
MAKNALFAMALVLLATACEPSVVRRGATTPPPGEAQLSPHDADVQYPEKRDKERS